MKFIVRYGTQLLATYEVDPAERYSRGNQHEAATDFANKYNDVIDAAGGKLGAVIVRIDDDGRERPCSTFNRAEANRADDESLSHEARNRIARRRALRAGRGRWAA